MPREKLVVLDFDWSLVEENSDTWVLHQLGASHIFEGLLSQGLPWTQLMDCALHAAHTELKATQEDVLKAICSTPFHADMIQVVRTLAAVPGCTLIILSDANTVFINEVLKHHKLDQYIHKVYSNIASWQDGALRVNPFHSSSSPHGCPNCPSNLCKGQVLDNLLAGPRYDRIVYLGDGSGDFCPCTRLRAGDYAVVRECYPTGKQCPLFRKAQMAGAHMVGCFDSASPSLASLPATARFGMEVKSGAACQVEDLSSQPGGFDAKCGLSTPGKERRLKAIPEWQLQPCKSTRGQRDSIAAIVCAWQTPSEAAALLEATVMQPMP
ncbi:g3185 [Coccomyxa viridis]|uniref:G3185 protein n=1 Tax=Coccomyxa viridis TaxID=1274662 RepID=A0ABP1FSK4_9CHLO